MVDYKKRFVDIEAGWPGSVEDSRIWKNSVLNRHYRNWFSQFSITKLKTGEIHGELIIEDIPPFILADSAYSNTKNMITTFKLSEVEQDPIIGALNKKLGGARYHVENAFGILKARFQIFQRPLECAAEDVRFAILLTCSIFVLHNFLIDVRDELKEDVAAEFMEVNEEEPDGMEQQENEDVSTRRVLIRHMQWLIN